MTVALFVSGLSVLVSSCSKEQLGTAVGAAVDILNNGLSKDDIIKGLKKALEIGAKDAVKAAVTGETSFAKNEAIKLKLPKEMLALQGFLIEHSDKLNLALDNPLATVAVKMLGSDSFEDLVDGFINKGCNELVDRMNQAAMQAAESGETLNIFKRAITEMTITDGLSILQGSDTAAMHYLREKTEVPLVKEFAPIVEKTVGFTEVTKLWGEASLYYNRIMSVYSALKKIPIVGSDLPESNLPAEVNTDINAYVVQEGLDGLFQLVGGEEKKIRENPMGYAESIIQKVFGSPEAKKRKGSK